VLPPGRVGCCCALIEMLRFLEPQGATFAAVDFIAARWVIWEQYGKYVVGVHILAFLVHSLVVARRAYEENVVVSVRLKEKRCMCPDCVRKYDLMPIQTHQQRFKTAPFRCGFHTATFWARVWRLGAARSACWWWDLCWSYGLRYLCLVKFVIVEVLTIPFELAGRFLRWSVRALTPMHDVLQDMGVNVAESGSCLGRYVARFLSMELSRLLWRGFVDWYWPADDAAARPALARHEWPRVAWTEVRSPILTVAFSQSSYILMTYRAAGAGSESLGCAAELIDHQCCDRRQRCQRRCQR
jgi:hypothetical protein